MLGSSPVTRAIMRLFDVPCESISINIHNTIDKMTNISIKTGLKIVHINCTHLERLVVSVVAVDVGRVLGVNLEKYECS